MKNKNINLTFLLAISAAYTLPMLFAFTSFADELRFGQIIYSGTGCPVGSGNVVYNSEQKSFKLSLDTFLAQAGRDANKLLDRKSCDLAFPVHIPSGQRIAVSAIKLKGTLNLNSGGNAKVTASSFFPGVTGHSESKDYRGPSQDSFAIKLNHTPESLVWSSCGGDTNLRLHTSIEVQSSLQETASITIEELGEIQILTKPCE